MLKAMVVMSAMFFSLFFSIFLVYGVFEEERGCICALCSDLSIFISHIIFLLIGAAFVIPISTGNE